MYTATTLRIPSIDLNIFKSYANSQGVSFNEFARTSMMEKVMPQKKAKSVVGVLKLSNPKLYKENLVKLSYEKDLARKIGTR